MRSNNNYFQTVAILCLAFLALKSFPSYSQIYNADQSINIAKSHLEVSQAYSNKSSYPRTVNSNGTIKRVSAGDWTCGFFPGALWLMYEYTGDNTWKSRAQEWTAGLENQKNNTTTHDVGFMIYSSFGNGYRLTQDGNYKSIIIKAAQSLSTRYNPTVGAIKSWNNVAFTYPVIIDNMMNLELLFYATKLSGDSSFYKIAKQHALTTILNHFRPDNSSYHVVDYDPVTGSVIKKVTWQGLNDLSDWARGQAWALYGFTICFRETGDPRFLDMAKKIADFYLTHPNMPSDLVPFWDFDAFDYRDASAAAIAASALLELSDYLPANGASYYNSGLNTLSRLSAAVYSANPGTNNNFFLMHSVGNKPANSEVDVPLIYADYFFLQALLKHKKPAPTVVATGLANQVNLQWNKSTGAASYKINRSLIQGGPYVPIGSYNTATTYNDLNVTTGNTYYYTVTPVNSGGDGIASGEVVGSPTGTSTQYSLIVTVAGNGVVTKFPDQASYTEGTTVTLTATAVAGNQFSGWTGDISGATNPISVVVGASNKLINANFVNDLIANVAPTTGRFYSVGTLSVGNTFYTDRTYAVTSVPAIIGSATILKPANDDKTNTSGNVVSFTLIQNADLYIAYDPRQTALPSWMNGWQKIPEQLGVSDSKINYLDLYTKYYNAGNVVLGGNLASPAVGAQTNYCLIAKPKSVTPAQYVLNTSTLGNGSLMRAPDLPSYAAGALVTLTAVPGANQRFSGWTGAITGIVNPVTVIMDGNKTIQAAFEPVPADYTLAVNVTGAGAVSKNPDQLSYVSGTSVTLTATPAAGQQFAGWSDDLTGVSNPVSVLIDGNKTILALFQPVISNYTLTVNISGSGLVMKNPDQPSYTSGTTVTLTAYPNAGQQFSGWSGDASGSANPISIILNSNKNITAAFQLLPPLISGISSKTGRTYNASILKTGAQVYTDRNYQAATLPAFLNNAPFIESPNDDRNNSSKSVFSFDLGQQTTVYVAYDSKAGTLPSWLKGWQLVQGQQILLNDPSASKLNLYQAVFSPGKLTFGGNLAKPAKGAQVNYFVIIADPSIQNTSTTLTATRNTLFANEIANGMERLDLKVPFLKIYPNPVVNGTLNIIANEYLPNENVSLKLFDITGKLIFVEFVRADFYGSIRKTLVLKRLVKGMFILQLAGESAIVRKKFLFE